MGEPESKIELICKRTNYYRGEYKGTYYCLVHEEECSCYNKDNKITVTTPSFGFGNTEKDNTFNLCKRTD